MAISAANIADIEALHGPENLYQWTNPHGTVTSTNSTVLQLAIDTCIEVLRTRGYSYTETDPIVWRYCVVFLHPALRDGVLKTLWEEFQEAYKFAPTRTVTTNALAASDSSSQHKFDGDKWEENQRFGSRNRGLGTQGW